MSFLSWNCRGLGNPATIQVLMDLVHSRKPNLIFLMETMVNKNRMESIRTKLGFKGCFVVDNVGHSGGLALLWGEGVEVDITGFSKHHVDSSVRWEGAGDIRWRLTGFYGCPERSRRRESWDLLSYLASVNQLPWVVLVIGDFNDLLCAEEKKGRIPHPEWLIRGFRETVESYSLRDFPFAGHQYTWEKSRGKEGWVEEKLDRVLVIKLGLMCLGKLKPRRSKLLVVTIFL